MCSNKSNIESSSQSQHSDIRLHALCLALLCMPLCALQNVPIASSTAFTGCNKALRCHSLRQHHQHTQPEPACTTANLQLLPGTDYPASSQSSKKKSPVQMLISFLAPCLCVCLQMQEQQRIASFRCRLPQQLPQQHSRQRVTGAHAQLTAKLGICPALRRAAQHCSARRSAGRSAPYGGCPAGAVPGALS